MIQDLQQNPDQANRFVPSTVARRHSSLKIISTSVDNFFRYFAHRHTHRHTDCYENITRLAEVAKSKSTSFKPTIHEDDQLSGGLRAAGRVAGHALIHPGVRRDEAEDTEAAAVDQLEVVARNDGIAVLEPRDDRRRVTDSGTRQSHVAVDQSCRVAWTPDDLRRD